MSRFLYNIGVSLYHLGIGLAAWFNPKAKAWVEGRKGNIERLSIWREGLKEKTPIIWMHCASLGEFEQGRPVLEKIRKDFPQYKIVLTFYSPSGYKYQKNYSGADWVGYLPADGRKNASKWLKALRPEMAIFVKYEFWLEHLLALFEQEVPTFLIAASFRKDQIFFKSYGRLFRETLKRFNHIFTQSANDIKLLQKIGISDASIAGDPRIDRVLTIASSPQSFTTIDLFKNNEKLLIAGSTWSPDEEILLSNQNHWKKDWKLLLVPHEVKEKHIKQICDKIQVTFIRFSEINENTDLAALRIVVLDKIGMLSQLYQYGDLAYIGGGFGAGIHNTLEPAAFNLPIIIGPKYHKFPEAVTLVNDGGAFAIEQAADFQKRFLTLQVEDFRHKSSRIVEEYISMNEGATKGIVGRIMMGR